MQDIMKRKVIGFVVTLMVYPIAILGMTLGNNVALAWVAFLMGPIGLLIMGPSIDGKVSLVTRLFKMTMGIAKWGWLLVPYFPIDLFVGAFFVGIALAIFICGTTVFAFVPALIDFIKTKIILKKENI